MGIEVEMREVGREGLRDWTRIHWSGSWLALRVDVMWRGGEVLEV